MPKPKTKALVPHEVQPKPATDTFQAHRLLGQAEAFEFSRRLLHGSSLMVLKTIKEQRSYLHLTAADAAVAPTWEWFCREKLALSHKTVDEHLRNLETLGAEFYEIAEKSGIGRNHFRAMRALPEGQRPEARNGHLLIPGQDPIPIDAKHSAKIHDAIQDCIESAVSTVQAQGAEEAEGHKSTKRELRAAVRRADGHHALLKRFSLDPEAEPPPLVERVIKLGNQAILVSSGLQEIIEEAEEADLGPQAIAEIDRVLVLIEESCSNTRGALVPERD